MERRSPNSGHNSRSRDACADVHAAPERLSDIAIHEESSLSDVAFAVCTALHRAGTTAVLTGGSAAAFYEIDFRSIELWSKRERMFTKFNEFARGI